MTSIPLGGGAEFDRIRAIARELGDRAGALGDDCAFLEAGGATLALSTDVSVEGVHFRREWLTLEEIGWRATSAALSDLAAAGAAVAGILVAITVPAKEPAETLTRLMEGAGAAAAAAGGRVLGGDLSTGTELSLAVTVIGAAAHPMHRRGARPGDRLWVTGQLGGARAALTAWRSGRTPAPGARERFARPVPRIEAGSGLARLGATAMLDLSDGLAGDATHLAAASGVALSIDLGLVPCHPAVAAEARLLGVAPGLFAAVGGEDYELLVAMPGAFQGSAGLDLTRIGMVSEGSGVVLLQDGAPVTAAGFDHFA